MDHKNESNPSGFSPEEPLNLQLEELIAEEAESPIDEKVFEELLIGEPIVAAPEESTVTAIDDAELASILQAAFSDIPGETEVQCEPQVTDATILVGDIAEIAAQVERAAEAEMEEAATNSPETQPAPEIPEEKNEEKAVPPMKKRRPKNPNRYGLFGIPHMVTTVIWVLLVVFIGAGLGRMIWKVSADMLAFGRENRAVTITIVEDDDLDDITTKLYNMGLIRYKGVFKFYGKLANAEEKIMPGTYHLNTIYDYNALVKKMSSYAARATTTVMIPEGYTCQQIFELLELKGVCTVEKLEEAAMNADLSKYWFLEGIDRSTPNCLEGYLFPDTYEFYLDYESELVLAKLLNTFNIRFSEQMQEKLITLNETLSETMRKRGLSETYIQEHQITIRELVIIASLVEKETSNDEESYNIASVIYNRLTNPGEYPFLNIDAALVYVVGHNALTNEDKLVDSPYNTYLYKGLIPGPIANPGLASLNAALSPENTKYYFYALNPETGVHKFFKTYEEHLRFLESLRKGG